MHDRRRRRVEKTNPLLLPKLRTSTTTPALMDIMCTGPAGETGTSSSLNFSFFFFVEKKPIFYCIQACAIYLGLARSHVDVILKNTLFAVDALSLQMLKFSAQ